MAVGGGKRIWIPRYDVKCGISIESVLGPDLYVLYINTIVDGTDDSVGLIRRLFK